MEEDKLHTCICQMEGEREGGREAEWEQMTAERGNRGTSSGDNFLETVLSDLVNMVSLSVGVKGLEWSDRAGVRGRRLHYLCHK